MSDSARSTLLDIAYTARFITLLLKDFEKWDAFKLEIIDKDGNIIKKRVDRRTAAEKKAFTKFHKVVLGIKKTLNKLGPNKAVSVVATIALLKEHCEEENVDYSLMESSFMQFLYEQYNIDYMTILEEVPTNSNPELTRYTKTSSDINITRRRYEPSTEKKTKKKKVVSKSNGRDTNR